MNTVLFVVLSAGLFAGCCESDEHPHSVDRDFTVAAATANYDAMAAGGMVATGGADIAVRSFGGGLASTDARAESDLQLVADSINLVLPTGPDGSYDSFRVGLLGVSGREFDSVYLTAEILALQRLIGQFQAELKIGQSATVQRYAGRWLQVIQAQEVTATNLLHNE